MTIAKQDFTKMFISAKYWLLGMAEHDSRYFQVLEIMEFCRNHHDGQRNGGDPEFLHQLAIFHSLRTQHKHLQNPAMVYSLAFAHDLIEDANQKTKMWISPETLAKNWGEEFTRKVLKLSKKIAGKDNPEYSLDKIFEDVDCGPVKGRDRVNNVSTMVGVFKESRLQRYVKETSEEFIPRIKAARKLFISQEAIYESIKLELINRLELINHIMENTIPKVIEQSVSPTSQEE